MPSVLQVELVAQPVMFVVIHLLGRTKSKPSRTSLTAVTELCQCVRIHNPAIKVTNP